MARSSRCSHCNLDWPAIYSYRDCPGCGLKTWICDPGYPMTDTEALSKVRHIRFEAYYEKRGPQALPAEAALRVAEVLAKTQPQHELEMLVRAAEGEERPQID